MNYRGKIAFHCSITNKYFFVKKYLTALCGIAMEQLEFIIMSLTSYNNTVVQLIRSVLDLESRNDTDAELISAQSFS